MFLPQLGFEWVVLWTIVIFTLIYTVFYYHLLLFSLLQYCCNIRLFNWYRFNQKIMCFIRDYCLKTGFLAKCAYRAIAISIWYALKSSCVVYWTGYGILLYYRGWVMLQPKLLPRIIGIATGYDHLVFVMIMVLNVDLHNKIILIRWHLHQAGLATQWHQCVIVCYCWFGFTE